MTRRRKISARIVRYLKVANELRAECLVASKHECLAPMVAMCERTITTTLSRVHDMHYELREMNWEAEIMGENR